MSCKEVLQGIFIEGLVYQRIFRRLGQKVPDLVNKIT